MDSMSNLTRKNIPDDGGVIPTTEPGIVEGAPLVSADDTPPQAATVKPGLDLPEFADVAYRTDVPEVVAAPTPAPEPAVANTPPAAPIPIPGGIMSAEDAKNAGLNVDDAKAIDVSQEQLAAEQRRFAEGQALKMRETTDMLAGALAEEEARAQRFENTENADAETREQLLGEDPKVVGVTPVSYEERMKDSQRSTNPEIDPYDLMPGYSDDDDPEEEVKDPDKTDPDPNDAEYGQFIRDLPVAEYMHFEKPAVQVIREPETKIVPSERAGRNHAPLGDQAFMNAINKFKKDNFGKVTVVMPNSGFMCDVVGTGVVDLQNLYMNVDQNMSTYDYQLEQMRVVIRNVVGTYPKVSANNLQNMIHFQDFQMLAFGHICATLRSVETVTNCTECGKAFRLTTRPNDLIMNMSEFSERRAQIENAPNIESCSLMTHNREVVTAMGLTVTLGHPSYADMIRCIRGFLEYSANMTETEKKRFESMLRLLYMIRKIKLPDGTYANNIYQMYQALLIMSDVDLDVINKEATAMRDEIMVPKFGIKEARCPHCGKIIKDIPYESLLEMLFYHTTISSYLNNPES